MFSTERKLRKGTLLLDKAGLVVNYFACDTPTGELLAWHYFTDELSTFNRTQRKKYNATVNANSNIIPLHTMFFLPGQLSLPECRSRIHWWEPSVLQLQPSVRSYNITNDFHITHSWFNKFHLSYDLYHRFSSKVATMRPQLIAYWSYFFAILGGVLCSSCLIHYLN